MKFRCASSAAIKNVKIAREKINFFSKIFSTKSPFFFKKRLFFRKLKGTDQTGTFMSLKCVVYYANYRSGHQSSKIQV